MLAKLKERDPKNRHCLRCGSTMEWRGGWMNSGRIVLFDKETKWIRCPACGFGLTIWDDGKVQTNQWAGLTEPDKRNIWKGEWKTIPTGALLVVSSEAI